MKRGRYNRPFLHLTTMAVLGVGVVVAPYLAETYPVFAQQPTDLNLAASSAANQSVLASDQEVFATQTTQVRGTIITYTVQKGDTLSTVAKKFGITEDSIKWENDLSGSTINVGDTLDILPVTGIAHKVQPGDTVYSVAKKYSSDAQKIVDWQFNEFANPETFTLVSGQILMVPDGIKPSEIPNYARPQVYIAQGPIPVSTGGFTYPVRGPISQFFNGYHTGVDILSPIGTPIVAAHNGTVSKVSVGTYDGGYGTNVYVSNGNGVISHYAHMSSVNVSVGQSVTGGRSVVGWVGMTGRTTGPHVHFEISNSGSYVNPLAYVQ